MRKPTEAMVSAFEKRTNQQVPPYARGCTLYDIGPTRPVRFPPVRTGMYPHVGARVRLPTS